MQLIFLLKLFIDESLCSRKTKTRTHSKRKKNTQHLYLIPYLSIKVFNLDYSKKENKAREFSIILSLEMNERKQKKKRELFEQLALMRSTANVFRLENFKNKISKQKKATNLL